MAPGGVSDQEAVFNEALLWALPDGVVTYAANGQCRSANRAAAALLGVPLDGLLGQNFRSISTWKESGLLDRAEATMQTGVSQQWEMLYTSTAGKTLWYHARLERVDLAGEPTLLLIFTDISERKALEKSLLLTQLSVDSAADLIHWIGPDGRLLYVSDSTCRRHGYSREELMGMTVFDLDTAETRETWKKRWHEVASHSTLVFESTHRTKAGELFPLELVANHVRTEDGEYVFVFGRDITERKKAEEAIRRSEEWYSTLLQQAGDGIILTDETGRIVDVNRKMCELLGYSREEMLAKDITDVDPSILDTTRVERRRRALAGEQLTFETYHRRKDGNLIPVEITLGGLSLPTGRAILGIARDISERKQAAEALTVEKERLSLLNGAAVEMSYCLTTADVERVGIRLACEASSCDGGIIWLLSSSERGRVIGSKGLARAGRAQLIGMLRNSSILESVPSQAQMVPLEKPDRPKNRASGEHVFSSALIVPVISRGKVLGVLCLGIKRGYPAPSPANIALGEGVAALVGVALENAGLYDQARYLAQRDSVTGLMNHRGINAQLEKELARSERLGSCFSVVMMDLDNFKLFNDTYGHAWGDKVLQHVSAVLAKSVRRGDTVGRYGGDEFVALLPDTDAGGAAKTIGRIRSALGEVGCCADGHSLAPVFMSYGVATYPGDGRRMSELLALADTNLYRSKRQGGNCVTTSGSSDERSDGKGGFFRVLDGLVTAVDGKDHYTRKHSDDVCELAVAVASELGLSSETQRSLRIAALLHDVGKLGIPDHILRKPGRLSEEELETIRQHVDLGGLITKGIPDIAGVMDAVSSHHERYDGRGYPHHLKGTDIPLLGRILAVADAYSAMTTDRPYRKALSFEDARSELKKVSGTQLDPRVVRAFIAVLDRTLGSDLSADVSSASVA